jgi:uncharacterized membrane protein
MEAIFGLMAIFGFFGFVTFGLICSVSIEAQENKRFQNISTALCVIGLICSLIGMVGLFIIS